MFEMQAGFLMIHLPWQVEFSFSTTFQLPFLHVKISVLMGYFVFIISFSCKKENAQALAKWSLLVHFSD
jgi:hypothetical protein